MNLHIIPNEKFTEPYIEFVNNNFSEKEHLFIILGKGIGNKIKTRTNVIELLTKDPRILINKIYKSKKIIIHGLFNRNLVLMLFFQPWLLKKCYWVIWGGDLYRYKRERKGFKSHLLEFMRKYVIKNMGGLITHIKGDYELAQEWYGAKGKYYYSFMYPSNLYKEYDMPKNKSDNKIYIQIGNSADPSNNHTEMIMKLSKYKDKDIKIICPLSYGNVEYREEIIKLGKDILGDKFIPLVDFMPFEEYLKILARIDVAIFNHERQQAMGNITTLLGLGKKVYIRDDITTWTFCEEHGLKVYSSNGDFGDLFKEMAEKDKEMNINNVKEKFSEEKLKKDWDNIFVSR